MQTINGPTYTLVIPALEEEDFIGSTLKELGKYLKRHRMLAKTEVVVVTADSKDRTREIVLTHQNNFTHFQFIQPGPRIGKGRDVSAGVLAARGEYILFTDADLATPLHHIVPAFKLLEGHDAVIGIRDLWRIHRGVRRFVSLSSNAITRLLVAPTISDTQCGFKGFRRDAAHLIFNKLTVMGWAFDMEVLAIARQQKLKIAALNIHDWTEHKPGHKQLASESNFKAAKKSLKEAVKIGKNRARRRYS